MGEEHHQTCKIIMGRAKDHAQIQRNIALDIRPSTH